MDSGPIREVEEQVLSNVRIVRGEVRACQRCGSGDLRIPGLRDGAMVGEGQELAKWVCLSCGLMAVPLLFDDEAARAAYAASRARELSKGMPPWPQSGWPSIRRPKDKGPGQ